MKKLFVLPVILLVSILVVIACGPGATPGSGVTAPPVRGSAAVAKAPWEQKWDGLLAAAKREGEVLVYTNINPKLRVMLSSAVKDKYGIDVQYVIGSSSTEIISRTFAEKRAGINVADVFITGASSMVFRLKPEGLLGALEPLFVLPEVLDPKAWFGGQLAYTDKDRKVYNLIGAVWGAYLRNTDMIKEGEITSYMDAVKPVYKGKITMTDPFVPGAANSFFLHLAYNLYNMEKATDFMRQLASLDPAVTRDRRLNIEWVARGRYSLSVGPDTKESAAFVDLGAPVAVVWPKEGAYVSSVGGSLGVPAVSPHPNATTVFVNWLLTKEGQKIFSDGFGFSGTRIDIPPGGHHKMLPPPDLKVFEPSSLEEREQRLEKEANMPEITRGVMSPLLK